MQTASKSAPIGRRHWPQWAAPETAGGVGREGQRGVCVCRWQEVHQRESKEEEQKLACENASRRPVGAKKEGGTRQTASCFGFQEDFWLCLWSVQAGLNLTG